MKKREEKELLKTPVFTVVEKTFEENDKELKFKPVGLNCNDWVMVIARDLHNHAIVVKQTRWGIEDSTIEFPCGTVEEGEDPRDAAIREFREEIGIQIENKKALKEKACFNPNPAYFNNKMYIYVVTFQQDLFDAFNNREHQILDENEDCIPMLAAIDNVFSRELSKHAMGIAGLWALSIADKIEDLDESEVEMVSQERMKNWY